MQLFKNLNKSFINGEWLDGKSGRIYEITDPFDNTVITTVNLANLEQIKDAFEMAKNAQKKWGKTTPEQRREVLVKAKEYFEKNKKEILDLITRETGGTILKSNQEFIGMMDNVLSAIKMVDEIYVPKDYTSVIPDKISRVYKIPLGVITSITPFNSPLVLGIRTIFPAIALGNSVVHKPDIQTGLTGGSIIAKALEEGGLFPGVFNMILTDMQESGDEFLTNNNSPFISFTGSSAVGKHIGKIAGEQLKQVALELGGNNPFVVLSDADVDRAVDIGIYSKFRNNGQVCACSNRIIVHQDIYDEFVTKYVERVKGLKVGDPKDPDTIIGPVINERQADKIMGFIEQAKQDGLKLAVEGQRKGNIISPFVFIDVPNDSSLAYTELFGPVAQIIPAETDEEAIRLANDTEFGLSASIITSDLEKGERLAFEIESGMTHINDNSALNEAHVPFGGVKQSGIGRFGYEWLVEEFTYTKWVTVQTKNYQYPF
ncbi:aldehyde dehydrogenase family protein [Bacillus sp. 1P02SD]|uniref:aldehyde dehydrogenase family protein n=1 Tax=Bacillus sp. 1P02SD TaxID=3132264 RepID=UPI0039A36AE7